jgi:hypothetical protein
MAHSLHAFAHPGQGLFLVYIVALAIVIIAILAGGISLLEGGRSFITPQGGGL